MTWSDFHLAGLNVGRLLAPTDDPRIANFMAALDRINALGKRMSRFVWMMAGSGEPDSRAENRGNTDAKIDGDPQYVPNLTVSESVATLEGLGWNTVHRQFYARLAERFDLLSAMHFVMWWVPQGHHPRLDAALAKRNHLRMHGACETSFGWAWLKEAMLWQERACTAVAAE